MSDAAPICDDELTALFAGLETTPLALAVSGGADSMALMHMVARWAAREDVRAAYRQSWKQRFAQTTHALAPSRVQWAGLPWPTWLAKTLKLDELQRAGGTPHIVVLTVDHGLRASSSSDAAFVAAEAQELGLPCAICEWTGDKPKTGIQEVARQARRDLMLDVLRAEAGVLSELAHRGHHAFGFPLYRALAMAHHQEDQAETFLMRLARGSGIDGLCGMRRYELAGREAVPERPDRFETALWRPLLDVGKTRLVATLQSYGAHWVEDPSNEDQRFERVRVRTALAELGKVGLSADKIALSMRRLQDAREAIERSQTLACDHEYGNSLLGPRTPEVMTPLYAALDLFGSRFASDYLKVRTLRWVMGIYGGSARPAELAQLEELIAHRLNERRENGGITLGGCKIEFHGEHGRQIRIYREGSGEGLPVLSITPGQTVDWDGKRFEISASDVAPKVAVVRALGLQGWAELKKAVPRLADLKWPAAAAATLPVVAVGEAVAAYPGVACVLASFTQAPPAVLADWATFLGPAEPTYRAQFGYVGL